MIAAAWLQHRIQLLAGAGLLGLLALFFLITGLAAASDVHNLGITACQHRGANCSPLTQLFEQRFSGLLGDTTWLNFVPMLAGVFWGAPLVAREIEQGTHRLAWTQSVSRRHWLTTKLALFGTAVLVGSVLLALIFTWWFHPFTMVDADAYSRMRPNVFDQTGIVPAAYGLYAFALGTAAGVVLRRTLPAMAVSIAGWLPLRLWLQSQRGSLLAPLHVIVPPNGPPPAIEHGAWVIDSQLVGPAGSTSISRALSMCPPIRFGNVADKAGAMQCLAAHGYHQVDIIQPTSHFWALQGMEAGIYVALALALLGFAVWRIMRRIA